MGRGGARGPFPREPLGERARRAAQRGDERRVGREGEHPLGQRPPVAVRHQESRLAVTHPLPPPRAVGGEGRRPPGRGPPVGDAPPPPGTGKYDRPPRAPPTPPLPV